MQRTQKERVVTELAEQLRSTESLIVADYRGLTNAQLEELRAKLRGSGARFQVVKNTLTRRAVEEVGSESLLALLEGPTAIAFVETDGDPVAVAKALSDTARDTKVLTLRGGLLAGSSIDADAIEALAKLPAPEVVKAQLVGVIVAPLTGLVSLLAAPVRDLVGLIDARIAQLEERGDASVTEAPAEAAPEPEAAAEVVAEDAEPEAEEPQAAAEPEATAEAPAESTEESEPTAAPLDTESEE
jgi:large subunit ribosomal protein L10